MGGIDSAFDPGQQKQEWVPKLNKIKIIEETEQEFFHLGEDDVALSDADEADKEVLKAASDQAHPKLSTLGKVLKHQPATSS